MMNYFLPAYLVVAAASVLAVVLQSILRVLHAAHFCAVNLITENKIQYVKHFWTDQTWLPTSAYI